MPLKRKHAIPEATRWLIVGGYEAGATAAEISCFSGVSEGSVYAIIRNFKRTGTPFPPKNTRLRENSDDAPSNSTSSSDNDSDDEDNHNQNMEAESTVPAQQTSPGSSIKRKYPSRQRAVRRVIRRVLRKAHTKTTKVSTEPPPPNQEQDDPLPPRLSSPCVSSLRQPDSGPITTTTTEQSQVWTEEEDRVLIQHALVRLRGGRWHELERRLEGRHTAEQCEARWKILREILLETIDQKGTQDW